MALSQGAYYAQEKDGPKVCDHCQREYHCEDCDGCLAPCCSDEDYPPRCSCGEDRM